MFKYFFDCKSYLICLYFSNHSYLLSELLIKVDKFEITKNDAYDFVLLHYCCVYFRFIHVSEKKVRVSKVFANHFVNTLLLDVVIAIAYIRLEIEVQIGPRDVPMILKQVLHDVANHDIFVFGKARYSVRTKQIALLTWLTK